MAGSTALLRRGVAMQVLLCGSVAELRRMLQRFLCSLRGTISRAVSLIRPKGAGAMLIMAALAALALRRRPAVGCRFWVNMMRNAQTYEDWAYAAMMHDKEMPRFGDTGLYDEELIRSKLLELQHRRREGSLKDMAFFLRTDLLRNLGNMCNPKLHNGRLQVPKLINDYIEEVSAQLKMVCKSKCGDFTLEERIAFVQETRHAFGRTALLLSGGATMAAFHLGVVKVLVDNKLLPRVLAGSSAGSVMCAIIATKSREEIESFFENKLKTIKFFDRMGGVFAVMRRVIRHGAVHEIRQLQHLMMEVTGNMTFQEAFDRTGRVLGVTVCSPRKNEPPRCLNYLTSPNVLIWSAVTASCAFPGLFEAQELMARDRFGNIVPYHAPFSGSSDKVAAAPTARRWRDGTLESDLPMMQLKELFNVNHFIVSQANPHISPWLRVKEILRSYGGDFSAKVANIFEMEVKHRFSQLLELGFPLRGVAKLVTQDWEGDITIVMPATLAQYSKIIVNPSFMDLKMALNQGSRCAWEKLSAIKATCSIEFALDESSVFLNHMQRLGSTTDKSTTAAVAAPKVHRRTPSWNFDAEKGKPTFLEEDLLADSFRSPKICRSPHSKGESGENREPPSWIIRGGQLTRTASSRRLASFVQSLDIASVKDSQRSALETEMREQEKRIPLSPNTILLADGDLLQPEKLENGYVLNVVKKEDYVLTPKPGNPEECQVRYSDSSMESLSSSGSGSESSGDDDDEDTIDASFRHQPAGVATSMH